MTNDIRPESTSIVIFGAGGDLTWRKLVPALYDLCLDQWLPERFAVFGLDVKAMSDDDFRKRLREGVDQFSRRGKAKSKDWDKFASNLSYLSADFGDASAFSLLADKLTAQDKAGKAPANRIFYLAVPPQLTGTIIQQLGKAHLSEPRGRVRIVVEKPFGHDLESARALNQMLTGIFDEAQIFRIDHYLGKETVQNILVFRFSNAVFEPIWNRRYIDHVQITVAESVGVEHRGAYYEHAGALRDMVQNHLMQVLCLIAMEPPTAFTDQEIRNKKVDVLRAVRKIRPTEVEESAMRGQYGAGKIADEVVLAYRKEPDVSSHSSTETFASVKLFIDNWRWQDVPFYLRTGKRLPVRASEVSIVFRPVPHQSFPTTMIEDWHPNRMAIRIQPNEGILLRCHAKVPGPKMQLGTVDMQFQYSDAFKAATPEAYETLLVDVMRGDATLFMRADQIECAWSIVTPILEGWADKLLDRLAIYSAGTWGPTAADKLISRDGRAWLPPTTVEKMQKAS